MKANALLFDIIRGAWAIDDQFALNSGPLVQRLLSGNVEAIEKDTIPYQVALLPNNNGAVAIHHINGTLRKADGLCGEKGTATISREIKAADADESIVAHIIQINSPGGTVDGTEALANVVANTKKPTTAIIDDVCASAAYWVGSQADAIYASGKTTQVGSIGVFVRFADMRKKWEAEGITFHTIKSDGSPDKVADIEKAANGDPKDLKEGYLNPIYDLFKQAVLEGRAGKINKEALTGKVYLTAQATELGLIDGISSLDALINNIAHNSNTNMGLFGSKNPKAQAALKAAQNGGEPTAELLTDANAELEEQGTNLRMVSAEDLDVATTNAQALADAQKTIATLTTERDTAKAETARVQKEFNDFKEKTPGAVHTEVTAQEEPTTSADQKYMTEVDKELAEKREKYQVK